MCALQTHKYRVEWWKEGREGRVSCVQKAVLCNILFQMKHESKHVVIFLEENVRCNAAEPCWRFDLNSISHLQPHLWSQETCFSEGCWVRGTQDNTVTAILLVTARDELVICRALNMQEVHSTAQLQLELDKNVKEAHIYFQWGGDGANLQNPVRYVCSLSFYWLQGWS